MTTTIYCLRAKMAGPISLRNPIDLEALLLETRGMVEGGDALTRPLDDGILTMAEDGTPFASMGFLTPSKHCVISVSTARRIKAVRFLTESDVIVPDKKNGGTSIGDMSPMRNQIADWPLYSGVDEMRWYFKGDPERVLRIAREIRWLGVMRNQGFGEVREGPNGWSVDEAEHVASPWTDRGHLLRRLPWDTQEPIDLEQRPAPMRGPVRPPYRNSSDTGRVLSPSVAAMIDYGKEIEYDDVSVPVDRPFYGQ